MPRYAILEHDYPVVHWDFLLEADQVLQTWRLAAPPAVGQVISAVSLPAHRRLYLDYEGPVSGNRGQVVRWDAGVFTWLSREQDRLAVQLDGHRLHGMAALERVQDDAWSFLFTPSEK
ncbi:MAG TPA: DNA polymerase ligase N-terminal domain-containing protein [Gemmataceae bacterium]|nr:DNA polymerase ligase N-terminal domain-containing protein [Gemmataceae bacterium]